MSRSRLWIPSSAEPKFFCDICGDAFYERHEQVRHVAKCAKKNRELLLELAEGHRQMDPLGPGSDAFPHEAVEFQQRRQGR